MASESTPTNEKTQAHADSAAAEAFRAIGAAHTAVVRAIDAQRAAQAVSQIVATVKISGVEEARKLIEGVEAERDAAVEALARAEAEIQRLTDRETVSPETVQAPVDTEAPSAEPSAYEMQGGTPATHEEPAPTGEGTPVWPLVIADVEKRWPRQASESVRADMAARDAEGTRKYGTPLRTANGRRPLVDAYQESLDQCVYLRQAIEEGGHAPDVQRLYDDALRLCWILESFMPRQG